MNKIDLHVHTNASDGEYSATEVIKKAIKNNIDTIAITDHDTIKGLIQMDDSSYIKKVIELGKIEIINGIELSAVPVNKPKKKGEQFHILGLGINPYNKKLNERLENGEVITVKHRINDEGDAQIIYKSTDYKGDVYHTINITSDGNISTPENPTSVEPKASFAKTINASNYGDYVEYSKDLELALNLQGDDTTPKTDWRIFYKDEDLDRVYLIAADYVPNNSNLLILT